MIPNTDLEKLIEKLPFFIQQKLITHLLQDQLIEIILDLGRKPEARFRSKSEYLSQKTISWQDLDYTTKQISQFSNENRAGIERTLHRISCIRNRQFLITGLTCRVGRVVFGTVSIIRDLLELEKSILILGKPGVGKTTIIREISRLLADELLRRVIIIDEIGTELEVLAARTIAEKGVQLIGTTHGNCIENLIKNPPLADLLGGIQYVTLSDEEAKRRGTQKSILERKGTPAFDIIVEINTSNF